MHLRLGVVMRWDSKPKHPSKKLFKSSPIPSRYSGTQTYVGPLKSLIGKHVYFWHPAYSHAKLSGIIRRISPDGKMMYTEMRNGGAGWSYIESPFTLILDSEVTDIMAKHFGGYSQL
jgi:hypothetical protein